MNWNDMSRLHFAARHKSDVAPPRYAVIWITAAKWAHHNYNLLESFPQPVCDEKKLKQE